MMKIAYLPSAKDEISSLNLTPPPVPYEAGIPFDALLFAGQTDETFPGDVEPGAPMMLFDLTQFSREDIQKELANRAKSKLFE